MRWIAIEVFEHNDAWHRIEDLEKAIKTLPGGRENLHRYIAVFGADPYDLAICGPSGTKGDFGEGVPSDRRIQQLTGTPGSETDLKETGLA